MKSINLKKVIPIFAIVLLITGALITNSLLSNKDTDQKTEDDSEESTNLDMADIAQVKDQFMIDNMSYIILSEEQKAEFGLRNTINESDIGDMLTTITTSVDADLIGSEVYTYLPVVGEAVVAVKTENNYKLFRFFTFESYNNNQDEDVSVYLELYGIKSATDIAKVQFFGWSEKAKIEGRLDIISEITDSGKITEFYNYYSVIKNSSDNYFDKLLNYKSSNNESLDNPPEQTEVPPDDIEGVADNGSDGIIDKGETGAAEIGSDGFIDKGETGAATSAEGFVGSAGDALNNSVTIRIYNQSGIYLDAEYYPNLSFISRHEVNTEFADFLKDFIE